MFPPEIIRKLGLIHAGYKNGNTVMFSSYMGIYLYTCKEDGEPLPPNIYMAKRTILGKTDVSYPSRTKILLGLELMGYLN